jgi:signal transduction histidine kinase
LALNNRMGKTGIIILFFCLLLFLNHSVFSKEERPDKNILIIYSYAPSTPAYQVITDGIRTKLNGEFGDAYNLHMEYLETEHYPQGSYPKEKFDIFNEKYQNVYLDLLILVGVNIVEPVKRCADDKLLALPVVIIDFDFSEYGINFDLRFNERNALVPLKLDVRATLDNALKLFPDRQNVYFIGGVSNTDHLYMKATKAVADKLDKSRKYTFITGISMDEALILVRKLPDSSIIVIPGFNTDSKMVPYYNPESIRLISQAANSPVFSYSDIGFGEGAIGGYILSFKKTGLMAGETVVNILNGADPNSIIISGNELYEYAYDWRQLKRWDLEHSDLLPKGCIIQFKETSFFGKYKMVVFIVIFFLLLQSILIINLIRSNRKKDQVSMKLIETENRFRELVREDRILSLGQMMASLSHELNQPLTSILSMSQAGNRYLESDNPDPEMLKEIFKDIADCDKRAASILSSIRGMMKLEQREKEKVNLNTLVEELVTIYESEAHEKRVSLIVKLADHAVNIIADRILIQQVILNFISNALQSIEKMDSENKNIIISEIIDNEIVIVSVRDYGEGIPESINKSLFKPFITSKKDGSGIGLAISRSIIEDHQGKIWAENMPDGGAMFSFSLKIFEDE